MESTILHPIEASFQGIFRREFDPEHIRKTPQRTGLFISSHFAGEKLIEILKSR